MNAGMQVKEAPEGAVDNAKRQQIVDGARKIFLAQGFDAANHFMFWNTRQSTAGVDPHHRGGSAPRGSDDNKSIGRHLLHLRLWLERAGCHRLPQFRLQRCELSVNLLRCFAFADNLFAIPP